MNACLLSKTPCLSVVSRHSSPLHSLPRVFVWCLKVAVRPLIVAATMLLVGCATTGTPIPLPQSQAALLFADKCGECHAVPHPARHSADEWPHYVALMERRMAERNVTALSDAERQLILRYLSKYGR